MVLFYIWTPNSGGINYSVDCLCPCQDLSMNRLVVLHYYPVVKNHLHFFPLKKRKLYWLLNRDILCFRKKICQLWILILGTRLITIHILPLSKDWLHLMNKIRKKTDVGNLWIISTVLWALRIVTDFILILQGPGVLWLMFYWMLPALKKLATPSPRVLRNIYF